MVASPRSSSKIATSMAAKTSKPETENSPSEEKPGNEISSPAKRRNNKGIRMIHGRIYDSENGKSCHQCRQKTLDLFAACKGTSPRTNRPCTISFCHKCLSNRYGEKAEVVGSLQEWVCPKCRGICNCSVCMKKQGHQPTGILVHTAKKSGFSSVTDLLQGGELNNGQAANLANKRAASEVVAVCNSPRKKGKENNFNGEINNNLSALTSPSNLVQDKAKKVEMEGSNKVLHKKHDKGKGQEQDKLKAVNKKGITLARRTSPRKHHISKGAVKTDMKPNVSTDPQERRLSKAKDSLEPSNKDKGTDVNKNSSILAKSSPRKHQILKGISKARARCSNDVVAVNMVQKGTGVTNLEDNAKIVWTSETNENSADIPLPEGFELCNIHDIDIPPKDVGQALQFLEFCAVFGEMLGVRKGQPEVVLRDLMQGRSSRRGKLSATVYFIIKMLSIIQTEQGEGSSETALLERNSWIKVLNKCISESRSFLGNLVNEVDGFEYMDSSEKLRVINFVCDEITGTAKIRNWIEEKMKEDKAAKNEHKGKVLAIKDKEKSLKQKMQDEMAKAILKNNGACLTIAEHDAIVSKIKREVAAAHTELAGLNGLPYKENKSSEVLRTEPMYLGIDGRTYWKLKCMANKSSNSVILQQDVGTGDSSAQDEKWFGFQDEQREVIEKRVNSLRGKRLRALKIA